MPFDIPDSWKWVRIGDLFQHNTGKALNSSDKNGRSYEYITTSNVYWNEFKLDQLKQMLFTDEELEKCSIRKGDLLVLEGGDVGRAAIWEYDFEMRIQNHIHRLRPYGQVIIKYIFYIFLLYKSIGYINGKGIGIKGLSANVLHNLLIPLPPLPEQKRIVAKIDELLPLVDRYEQAWQRLEVLNSRFPVDMQKSVLQLAIQGKLVPQLPEEGTGEDLFRQIQSEKQALIQSGKIKKEKPLPEITEDEISFDIPESWKWVRLRDISSMCLGKMLDRQKNTGTPCLYLRNVNVRWGSFDLSDLLEMKFDDKDDERFLIRKNDLVMCEGGEPGRCAVWESDEPFHFQKALHRIRFYGGVYPYLYGYFFLLYNNNGLLNSLFTGATIKHLTGQVLERVAIPLPPLAEQKRIVARLEELLPLCERLR